SGLRLKSALVCSWTRAENVLLPQFAQAVVVQPSRHVLLAKMAETALSVLAIDCPHRLWFKLIHQCNGLSGHHDLCARCRRGKQIGEQGDRCGVQPKFWLVKQNNLRQLWLQQ